VSTDRVAVHGVVKSFGRVRALDHVSMAADWGVTALLGRNGAGKSTLLRILATSLTPDAGQVRLLGRDPGDAKTLVEIRRRLGYLPQDVTYYRPFTAFDYVDYVAILKEISARRARHDEVRRVLDLVGLSDVAHRRMRGLSMGMRRRAGIAQALLGEPDLLLLDEPAASLDREQRLAFLEMIAELGERRTIIMATHDTADIAAVCHRVVVVDAGQVVAVGTPAELIATAENRVWTSIRPDPRARLSWRTGTTTVRNLGVLPADADPVEATLEDAYLLLVNRERVPAP
jgi:ABC-2 type transport system ATP-binding protein